MKKIIIVIGLILFVGSASFAQEAPTIMSFSIPANRIDSVVTAFCETNNYLINRKIGETRLQFTERMIRNHIRDVSSDYEFKVEQKESTNEIRNRKQTEMEDIVIGTN